MEVFFKGPFSSAGLRRAPPQVRGRRVCPRRSCAGGLAHSACAQDSPTSPTSPKSPACLALGQGRVVHDATESWVLGRRVHSERSFDDATDRLDRTATDSTLPCEACHMRSDSMLVHGASMTALPSQAQLLSDSLVVNASMSTLSSHAGLGASLGSASLSDSLVSPINRHKHDAGHGTDAAARGTERSPPTGHARPDAEAPAENRERHAAPAPPQDRGLAPDDSPPITPEDLPAAALMQRAIPHKYGIRNSNGPLSQYAPSRAHEDHAARGNSSSNSSAHSSAHSSVRSTNSSTGPPSGTRDPGASGATTGAETGRAPVTHKYGVGKAGAPPGALANGPGSSAPSALPDPPDAAAERHPSSSSGSCGPQTSVDTPLRSPNGRSSTASMALSEAAEHRVEVPQVRHKYGQHYGRTSSNASTAGGLPGETGAGADLARPPQAEALQSGRGRLPAAAAPADAPAPAAEPRGAPEPTPILSVTVDQANAPPPGGSAQPQGTEATPPARSNLTKSSLRVLEDDLPSVRQPSSNVSELLFPNNHRQTSHISSICSDDARFVPGLMEFPRQRTASKVSNGETSPEAAKALSTFQHRSAMEPVRKLKIFDYRFSDEVLDVDAIVDINPKRKKRVARAKLPMSRLCGITPAGMSNSSYSAAARMAAARAAEARAKEQFEEFMTLCQAEGFTRDEVLLFTEGEIVEVMDAFDYECSHEERAEIKAQLRVLRAEANNGSNDGNRSNAHTETQPPTIEPGTGH